MKSSNPLVPVVSARKQNHTAGTKAYLTLFPHTCRYAVSSENSKSMPMFPDPVIVCPLKNIFHFIVVSLSLQSYEPCRLYCLSFPVFIWVIKTLERLWTLSLSKTEELSITNFPVDNTSKCSLEGCA